MLRSCVLPPRHLLLICNDPSLSIYDDLHIPKYCDKIKQNKHLEELDHVELKLDKQFSYLASNKILVQSKKNQEQFDCKIDQNTDLKNVEENKDRTIQESDTDFEGKSLKTTVCTTKVEQEFCGNPHKAKNGNDKTEDDSDLTSLDVDKCVLTEKNINIDVIESIDLSIYNEKLKEFSNFLINVNLFNKAKVKIDECMEANQRILKLNTNYNHKIQSKLFSNSINTNFLQRNSDEVCLRKRKGRKRKATEIEIIF